MYGGQQRFVYIDLKALGGRGGVVGTVVISLFIATEMAMITVAIYIACESLLWPT